MQHSKPTRPGRKGPSTRSLFLAVVLTLVALAVIGLVAIRQKDKAGESNQKLTPTPPARHIERETLRSNATQGT